jgi:hypothetical protein
MKRIEFPDGCVSCGAAFCTTASCGVAYSLVADVVAQAIGNRHKNNDPTSFITVSGPWVVV